MKLIRIMPLLLLAVAVVAAQSVPEKTAINFTFEHSERYAARLYTNGVLFQSFTLAEVAPVSTNSFRVTSRALPRGQFVVTATVVDADGTESDPSNAVILQVKPGSPKNLRL